jgi:RNA polymerase sigma-70 factor (ECF subfamily)
LPKSARLVTLRGMESPLPSAQPPSTPAGPNHGHETPVEVNRAAEQLARYARGDQRAFEELVADHQAAAYAAAWRVLGDGEAARDTVQEAFLRILRHRERYQASRPFRSWLLHIVRNLAIDALRRRRRFDHPDRLENVASPALPNPFAAAELRQCVAEVLDELPGKYREIIVMREMEGRPAEDIAREIGVDYSTTRWRLHQARRLFREAWIARFGEEA